MTQDKSPRFNKRKKVAFLLSILLLPSFFYLILGKGSHHYKSLPYIGPREIVENSEPVDTIFHSIPRFRFLDQNGDVFTNDNLKGNIYIANFFFTRCPSICPKMAAHLLDLQIKFKDRKDVKIVSFTVDPEFDTVEVLATYAEKVHANPDQWTFLTGSKDAIYEMAFQGFFAPAQKDETAPGGFLHSQLIFIVDQEGKLRGSYNDEDVVIPAFDGTKTAEMRKLADAIDNLLLEEYVPKKKKK